MKIGLTYDLRDDYLKMGFTREETVEFDRSDTIEAIDDALRSLGHETFLIGNIWMLVELLAAGRRWDMVFNIAEGLFGFSRESQVPALLDAYRIPYTFSDPVVLGLTLNKGLTKQVIRDYRIPTADFAIVSEMGDVEKICMPYPLFVKPVAEGTSKGVTEISKVDDPDQLKESCRYLLNRFNEPVLVERYLNGREFTVGITGTGEKAESLGILEVNLLKDAQQHAYSYHNKANFDGLVEYTVVSDETALAAEKVALDSWKALNCRDCGRVDLRCDEKGMPNFMEVNPLAGLNPTVGDLPILCRLKGIPFRDLIRKIMDSATLRLDNMGIPGLVNPESALLKVPGQELVGIS